MNDTATILRKAADLLTPEGAWMQGAFWRDDDGRLFAEVAEYGADEIEAAAPMCFCIYGAIAYADGCKDAEHYATGAYDRHLRAAVGTPLVVDWNDTEGRTQAEVVAALRKAADLAEAQT